MAELLSVSLSLSTSSAFYLFRNQGAEAVRVRRPLLEVKCAMPCPLLNRVNASISTAAQGCHDGGEAKLDNGGDP